VRKRSLELCQELRRYDDFEGAPLQALRIAAGVPAGANSAEMTTLGSRTARKG
jgi:hypothetical protein